MARTKTAKKEIVEKVKTIVDGAKSLVFVNVHGLKVADTTAMRKKLKSDKVGFFVAKKTLSKIALNEKNFSGNMPELVGEFGMAYGEDLVAPARSIFEFQNKHKGMINIVGGVFEGKYMSKEEMIAIASIPPANVLHGMFVNIINSPIQRFVIALNEISKKK
jgi:large subunit ribosomal protein L10